MIELTVADMGIRARGKLDKDLKLFEDQVSTGDGSEAFDGCKTSLHISRVCMTFGLDIV